MMTISAIPCRSRHQTAQTEARHDRVPPSTDGDNGRNVRDSPKGMRALARLLKPEEKLTLADHMAAAPACLAFPAPHCNNGRGRCTDLQGAYQCRITGVARAPCAFSLSAPALVSPSSPSSELAAPIVSAFSA